MGTCHRAGAGHRVQLAWSAAKQGQADVFLDQWSAKGNQQARLPGTATSQQVPLGPWVPPQPNPADWACLGDGPGERVLVPRSCFVGSLAASRPHSCYQTSGRPYGIKRSSFDWYQIAPTASGSGCCIRHGDADLYRLNLVFRPFPVSLFADPADVYEARGRQGELGPAGPRAAPSRLKPQRQKRRGWASPEPIGESCTT